ncbi:bucky ball-like [Salvelinus fontinalis]|uniref:bucky ball-like n=1 Tax=Salvelinus fontinalis TaxID=8038 RepID=UPI0024854545|nr:bucky ball-like [Salvelinus fontinalis]
MDEGSKHPQSMESGQHNQRQVNHPRPFFYVQPASQPYDNMYNHHNQWHNMNNPYNHYGFPGSGVYPFGRPSPYMSAYPYMQYPGGYVVPHMPHMHPVDYRRMYEPPHFHLPPVHDPMFRQQQQQPHHHDHTQREVVCSEAQTDPSDALNKLIECLDKLRANEMQGSEKELDSGVVSQSSGIFSPDGERKSCKVVGDLHSGHGASCGKLEGSQLQSSFPMGRLFSVGNSTAAVYDGESSRSLGGLGQEGWAVDSDEDPPLDSSSIHEENLDPQQHAAESLHCCSLENLCLQSAVSQSEDSPRPENIDNEAEEDGTNPDATSSTEGSRWQGHCSNLLSTKSLPSPLASDWQALGDTKCGEETFDVPDRKGLSKLDVDLSYQILHLPFDKVLTAGALQKDCFASSSSALLCGGLQASLSSSQITNTSSPARHHYYSYYCPPQTAHGRLSVLSPSLDELSSREEMFSTDLEDMDRFPRSSVYAGRRFPAEVEHLREPGVKVCPKSKKLLCACCGSSLLKGGASRVKMHHSPRVYADDEAGDSDEVVEQEQQSARTCDESAHPTRVVVQKHSVPKKHQPLHIQQHPKPSCKRGQCREAVGPEEQQEEPEMVLVGAELEYYEGHVVEGGQDAGDKEHRTCKDGVCREGIETSEPGRRERGTAKPRRKPHASLQERLALRKALWKPLVYQRVRDEEKDNDDEEEEPPRCHRGKGSTKRGDKRC